MINFLKIIGITLLLNSIVLLVGISYSNASEFNSILKGDYVFSTTRSCAAGPIGDGFNEDLSRSADGSSYTEFAQGILTFNGDGTGSLNFTILQIYHKENHAGQYPVWQQSGSGTLLYTVYENKTFTVEAQATTTIVVGPVPGYNLIGSGIEWDGWIGQGNQLLLYTDVQPNIEITTLENGATIEAICGRISTSMRKKMIE